MSSRRLGHWLSAWWPVVLGILVIMIESTEWFGSDHTDGPLRALYQGIFGQVPDARWDVIHHHIRKTGHFVGYGLIGLAWLRAWRMSLPKARFMVDAGLALLGTVTIASLDEYHQSFLPNRTSSAWDVLIDCSGAVLLQLAVYGVSRLRTIPRERAA